MKTKSKNDGRLASCVDAEDKFNREFFRRESLRDEVSKAIGAALTDGLHPLAVVDAVAGALTDKLRRTSKDFALYATD
jgi:hypothetical protein